MITSRYRQRGVYTLVVSILVVAAAMLAVRGLTRSALVETRVETNEEEIKEVLHAAEAALDYGISWYALQDPVWIPPATGTVATGVPTTPPPDITYTNAAGNTSRSYSAGVNYSRDFTNALSEGYVLITATAVSDTDASVTATVRQFVHDNYLLGDPTFTHAPLVVKGCLTNVLGTPDIEVPDLNDEAIVSLQDQNSSCVDPGHLDVFYPDPNDPNDPPDDFLQVPNSQDSIGYKNDPTGDLWEYMFPNISRPQMQAIAAEQVSSGVPYADRTVVWVTPADPEGYLSSSNYSNSAPRGSETSPIILVFDAAFDAAGGCPGFQGNQTIWGVIFVDGDCPDGNGWGQLTVNGTVAINGDFDQYNANTEINNLGVEGGDGGVKLKSPWVARIPGSWRDFL